MNFPNLIVSTASSLCVIREHNVEVIEYDRALYFGITWSNEFIFVACNFKEHDSKIAIFDHKFRPVDQLIVPALNIHQIIWNGSLYATLTEANKIAIVNQFDGRILTEVYYSGGSVIDGVGEDHTNSVWFDDRGRMWLCDHRQSSRFNRPSRIRVLERDTKAFEIYVGRNAHNVYTEGDWIYTNNSSEWKFKAINWRTGDRKFVDVGGFSRGLGRIPGGFVVGVSKDQPRAERMSSDSKVVIINDEFEIVDEVALIGHGDVQDLRVLGISDPSHNGIKLDV